MVENGIDPKIVEDLLRRVEQLESDQANHTHAGNDGSSAIYNDSVVTKPGVGLQAGRIALVDGIESSTLAALRVIAGVVVGDDTTGTDGVDNTQLTFDHQVGTTGSTNQTFLYGLRPPLFIGTKGTWASAGSTVTVRDYTFTKDQLAGAWIVITNPADSSDFEGYQITSNTESIITISGASFGFDGEPGSYIVFVPVYHGAANYPWRRLYTLDGSGGGIRFGLGATAGGQNGLLYMDAVQNGGLAWRNKAGSTAAIYSGTGAPAFSAAKGSLFVRTDGSSTSTRMYINTDGSTTWTNFTTAA